MSVVTTDLDAAVSDAAAHLYVWALKDIPQDLRDALADAAGRETSVTGQRVLQTILRNVTVAEDEKNLVCQDTGIAVYYCQVGEHFPLHPARIYAALREGTERGWICSPRRCSATSTSSAPCSRTSPRCATLSGRTASRSSSTRGPAAPTRERSSSCSRRPR